MPQFMLSECILFVSEAYIYTGPTVSSGLRTTETTVKVSTLKIRDLVVPAFSRERESNLGHLYCTSPTRYR